MRRSLHAICDGIEGQCRSDEPVITCAECRTDSECRELCEVGPCEYKGQTGCYATVNLETGEEYP